MTEQPDTLDDDLHRWRALTLLLGRAWRAAPRAALLGLVITPIAIGVQALDSLALKFLADDLVSGDTTGVVRAAVALIALTAIGWLAGWGGARVRLTLQERAGAALSAHVAHLVAGLPGIAPFEDPRTADELQLLKAGHGRLGGTFNILAMFLGAVVQASVSLVLLASIHPVLLAMPAVAVLPILAARRDDIAHRRLEERTAGDTRLAASLWDLAVQPSPAKELRVFDVREEVARREDQARDRVHDLTVAVIRVQHLRGLAAYTVVYLVLGAGLAFVVHEAVAGRATVGDVLMAASLVTQLFGNVQGLAGGIARTLDALRYADHYRWVVDYAKVHARQLSGDPTLAVPDLLVDGIHLDHVSFHYPGTDREILTDVTVTLPAGSVVALVGDNGAGKTTLVKMLARLYDPTLGTIRIDSTPLTDLDPSRWRTAISAGFQDFAKWQFLVREAVGISDPPAIDDDARLIAAMSTANANDLPDTLPHGLNTQLGREWDQGIDLSEGQWQKIALARAATRTQPLLLILDEPTASLDPDTEQHLFDAFAHATRTRRATGAITLLVSHRFSTVRMADLIIVLDQARVREIGTHAQLMANDDLYAELFTVQANAYR